MGMACVPIQLNLKKKQDRIWSTGHRLDSSTTVQQNFLETIEMFNMYIVQYSSHKPHMSIEYSKCG